MSRTYRNRKTVPKGLRVNDGCISAIDSDGVKYTSYDGWKTSLTVEIDSDYRDQHNTTYFVGKHRFWGSYNFHTFRWHHTSWYVGYHGFDPYEYFEWDIGNIDPIDKITFHNYAPAWRRGYYSCERKDARKQHQREYRAKCKNLMRHGRYDDLPRFKKTGGWLSW